MNEPDRFEFEFNVVTMDGIEEAAEGSWKGNEVWVVEVVKQALNNLTEGYHLVRASAPNKARAREFLGDVFGCESEDDFSNYVDPCLAVEDFEGLWSVIDGQLVAVQAVQTNTSCVCPIKDLTSTGHTPGCPERRR